MLFNYLELVPTTTYVMRKWPASFPQHRRLVLGSLQLTRLPKLFCKMLSTKSPAQILRLLIRNQLRQNGFLRYYSTPSSVLHTTNLSAPHVGTIKVLSLNRPQARNAISKQLLAELSHEINTIRDEPENGPTRALILASAVNESFCAGADLKERATFTQDECVTSLFPPHYIPRPSTNQRSNMSSEQNPSSHS